MSFIIIRLLILSSVAYHVQAKCLKCISYFCILGDGGTGVGVGRAPRWWRGCEDGDGEDSRCGAGCVDWSGCGYEKRRGVLRLYGLSSAAWMGKVKGGGVGRWRIGSGFAVYAGRIRWGLE